MRECHAVDSNAQSWLRRLARMDEYDEIDVAPVFLPGVDLALWLRLIAAFIGLSIVGGAVAAYA